MTAAAPAPTLNLVKVAFVRSEGSSAVFEASGLPRENLLEHLKISAKAGSSSKNVIMELLRRGLVQDATEWKFWDEPSMRVDLPDLIPTRVFEMHEGASPDFEDAIASEGAPDFLWVEGPEHPAHLELVFRLCSASFKLVYSKDWKPWNVERIEQFDLCLVDEEAQAQRLRKRFPRLHTGVWDKLIDYEQTHVPLGLPKEFDVCYVAYFRERKNHELLVSELAKLKDRNLRSMFVGGDRKGRRSLIQSEVWEQDIDVTFVDEVSKEQVNELVNRSRIGVMAAEKDAAPRVILEYLAANVPVVVNADLRAGARYVDKRSGIVAPPDKMHEAIASVLDNYADYRPREAYLARFDRDHVISTFCRIMAEAGRPLENQP